LLSWLSLLSLLLELSKIAGRHLYHSWRALTLRLSSLSLLRSLSLLSSCSLN
jgi:hypothetical protein